MYVGPSATLTHLVVENDLETLRVGANSLPSDGVRTASAPLGVLIRADDLHGVDGGQERDGRDDDLGEHLACQQGQPRWGRARRVDHPSWATLGRDRSD